MKNIKYKNISFEVPNNWDDNTVIIWTGPIEGNITPSVVVADSELPKGKSFESYVTSEYNDLIEEADNFVLHERNEYNVKGIACIKNKHSWRADGQRITQLQYNYLSDGIIYTVTCTNSLENFSKTEEIFEKIVTSFQILV